MEVRKLIKSGQSSLVIVLPQKWIESNNLKKGDQVYLDRNENKIVISSFLKKLEESKFVIEKNRDTERFLDTLLYAGFLSDKKTIVINNVNESDFYELLKLIKKFHYLKFDEKTEGSVKLVFIADPNSVDVEKEIGKISYFFDIFFQLFIKEDCKKNELEEAYDQISSQILFCMKVLKLKFLDYSKNIILRMKQQLDSYYFLLITCKNLIDQFRICLGDKKMISIIKKLRVKLKNLNLLIAEDNLIDTLKFWELNEKDKEELLKSISKERSVKNIHLYFVIYNAFTTLENITYSYFNNR